MSSPPKRFHMEVNFLNDPDDPTSTMTIEFDLNKIVVMGLKDYQFMFATQHGVYSEFYNRVDEAKRFIKLVKDKHGWRDYIHDDSIVNPRHVLTYLDDEPCSIDISKAVFDEIEEWCF